MAYLFLSLFVLFIYALIYAIRMDKHEKRERKERKKMFEILKRNAIGDPDRLRLLQMHEIELNLADKIMYKIEIILHDEDSKHLYGGASQNNKPDGNELIECLTNYGYQPDMFDDKLLNIIKKLAEDPDLSFLMKHGIGNEAELRCPPIK